jgi:hypothetical protein
VWKMSQCAELLGLLRSDVGKQVSLLVMCKDKIVRVSLSV